MNFPPEYYYNVYILFRGKKKFTYGGCGWKGIDMKSWSNETKQWILKVSDLFMQMFRSDFLFYTYDKYHGTRISDEVSSSVLEYDHEHWEVQYAKSLTSEEERENESSTFCSPVASDHIEAFLNSQAAKPASKLPKRLKISDKLSVTGPSVFPDIVSKGFLRKRSVIPSMMTLSQTSHWSLNKCLQTLLM